MIEVTNQATGEVIELDDATYEEVVAAWQVASQYEKVGKAIKAKLKKLVPKYVDDKGMSEPYNGVMFRHNVIQRRSYDKSVLREVLDEDTFDLMMKPDKKAVDEYLKEHLEELGDASTRLRETMVVEGKPYEVIKLERLER
jgi:hypothetical protein